MQDDTTMTDFKKWWATTGYTEMDGPVPGQVAEEAWYAAYSYALEVITKGLKDNETKTGLGS